MCISDFSQSDMQLTQLAIWVWPKWQGGGKSCTRLFVIHFQAKRAVKKKKKNFQAKIPVSLATISCSCAASPTGSGQSDREEGQQMSTGGPQLLMSCLPSIANNYISKCIYLMICFRIFWWVLFKTPKLFLSLSFWYLLFNAQAFPFSTALFQARTSSLPRLCCSMSLDDISRFLGLIKTWNSI